MRIVIRVSQTPGTSNQLMTAVPRDRDSMRYAFAKFAIAFALLSALTLPTSAQSNLPQPKGFVSDFAGKLSPETQARLDLLLRNFRDRSGGIEIGVVTMSFDDLQGYPIEDYALALGRQWNTGRDSDHRSMLLLVAIKPPEQGAYHGATRLEVSRKLEGDVPDGLAGDLIRNMRDDFQAGRFDQAITSGTQTILATLADRLHISMDGIDQSKTMRAPVRTSRPPRSGGGISLFTIIIFFFIFLAIIRAIGGGRRGGGGGGGWWILPFFFSGWGGGGSGWGGGNNDSGWGGGSSDSGWSGGGGDFGGSSGGGDFGGGGASDSW
jgi:uncharacterized protein